MLAGRGTERIGSSLLAGEDANSSRPTHTGTVGEIHRLERECWMDKEANTMKLKPLLNKRTETITET